MTDYTAALSDQLRLTIYHLPLLSCPLSRFSFYHRLSRIVLLNSVLPKIQSRIGNRYIYTYIFLSIHSLSSHFLFRYFFLSSFTTIRKYLFVYFSLNRIFSLFICMFLHKMIIFLCTSLINIFLKPINKRHNVSIDILFIRNVMKIIV